jgi:hypothetical protein
VTVLDFQRSSSHHNRAGKSIHRPASNVLAKGGWPAITDRRYRINSLSAAAHFANIFLRLMLQRLERRAHSTRLISTSCHPSIEFCRSRKAVPPAATIAASCFNSSSVHGLLLMNHFQHIGFLNSRNGTVGKNQFIPFARAEIFNNRVSNG